MRSRPSHLALPPSLPPRGLSRATAAAYIGIGVTKFDQLVNRGLMPKAVQIDGRKVWDRIALDRAFEAIGVQSVERNEWDDV